MRRLRKYTIGVLSIIILLGYLIPDGQWLIPVEGASQDSWDKNSFWAYPWGESGTHKGIDIFAPKHTPVVAPTSGIVLATDEVPTGGKIIYVLSAKWKLHYFAHLDQIKVTALSIVSKGSLLGTVGNTGNAANRPSHLHYSISTPFPYFWLIDDDPQGWKKMFYLNPEEYLVP